MHLIAMAQFAFQTFIKPRSEAFYMSKKEVLSDKKGGDHKMPPLLRLGCVVLLVYG